MPSIDPQQLGQWFDQHAPALLLYAQNWLDGQEAQDLVQEAFLKLLSQRRPPRDAGAWLFRSVRNAGLNGLRSRRRRQVRHRRAAEQRPEWFRPTDDDRIDARAAQAALEALAPDLREPVLLRIWGELTFAQIAELTGQSASTVFDRYTAALAELRRIMEKPCQTKRD